MALQKHGEVVQYGGMAKQTRGGYPSDVSDEEWGFVAPYLTLCHEDSAQREYPLRVVFNAVRYVCPESSVR